MARELQPHILINNRAGLKEDLTTPEQRIPPTGLVDDNGAPLLWEACMTMTSHWWGYDEYEQTYKSPEFLIRMLIDIVSKGGNLLLNVGPKPNGRIQKEFRERLKAIGAWLDKHGKAIYGTTASPFNLLPFHGRVTTKGSRLYVHVFHWPAERQLRLPRLRNDIQRAWLLGKKDAALTFVRDGQDWLIHLPAQAPDPVASVIGVDLDGPPDVGRFVVTSGRRGAVALPALYGAIEGPHGQRICYETRDDIVHAGNWVRTHDTITWRFRVRTAGVYRLILDHAIEAGQGGSQCAAVVNRGKGVPFRTESTKGLFVTRQVATVRLRKGMNSLQIRATSIRKQKLMDLRSASLKRVSA
jgi:alpha-L-fucosidase